jgi:carbonic anhydrase
MDIHSGKLILEELIQGNLRFQKNQSTTIINNKEVLSNDPKAIILSCIDSRVIPEVIFDQGIGDLYVSRIAGNIENKDIMNALEFACNYKGCKVLLILGHEDCGAITAVCDNHTELFADLKPHISPAINEVSKSINLSEDRSQFISLVSEKSILLTLDRIRSKSVSILNLEKNNEIILVGAMYNLESGKVKILN